VFNKKNDKRKNFQIVPRGTIGQVTENFKESKTNVPRGTMNKNKYV
jgi:hypothetical protein